MLASSSRLDFRRGVAAPTGHWPAYTVETLLATIATISLVVLPVGRYLLFPELHNDFHFTFLGALALREGLDPYLPASMRQISEELGWPVWSGSFEPAFRRWTHPPISGLIVLPLTPLGEVGAFLAYYVGSLLCSVGAFALATRLARTVSAAPDRTLWRVTVVCLSAWPICTSLALGQVNGFIVLALVVSALGALRRDRWGAMLAGAPLGLAAGLKIVPGIFIVYLLVTRRWAAVGWAIVAGIVTLALPVLALGHEITVLAFWRSLGEIVGGSAGMDNITLPGLLLRLWVGREGLYSGEAYRLTAPWWLVSWALTVGFVAWGLARARMQPVAHAYLTLSVVALLAAPVAWIHYVSWLLPFVIAPLAGAFDPQPASAPNPSLAAPAATDARVRRRVLIWSLALVAFLPLHELVWTQRLPDWFVALPWWQVGLLGLLYVATRESHGPVIADGGRWMDVP